MTIHSLLIVGTAVYLGAMVATAYFTRATPRRVAGALGGGAAVAIVGLGIEALAHHLGWWRYPGVARPVGPLLIYPALVAAFASLALIAWRITRRFGGRGLAVFLLAITVVGTIRDYRVAAILPNAFVLAPGFAVVLIDAACWAGLLALAVAAMRLIAGPADGDRLARSTVIERTTRSDP